MGRTRRLCRSWSYSTSIRHVPCRLRLLPTTVDDRALDVRACHAIDCMKKSPGSLDLGKRAQPAPTQYIGGGDCLPARSPHGRGGARNAANRTSATLSLRQCQTVWAAAHYSVAIGLPLNRFITINWTTAKVDDVCAALTTYLCRVGDWLRNRGVGLAYVWVHETTGGRHTHLILHVPPSHGDAFGKFHRRWLRSVGVQSVKGAINTRAVGAGYYPSAASPQHHLANLTTATQYILKEAAPDARHYAGRFEPEGRSCPPVVGKRCGVSMALGPQARGKARFAPPPPSPFL